MRYRISEKCIQCFACIRNRVCPEQAILERDSIYAIDHEKCSDCGTCYLNQRFFCPVRAFVDDEAVASSKPVQRRPLKSRGIRRRKKNK